MPLSRLSFQAPELIVRGGEALAAGIANGGQSLGRGLEQLFSRQQAEKERLRQNGELAASLRKTLSIAYPERSKEWQAMGLPDLRGVLEGEALASAKRKQKQAEADAAEMAKFAQTSARSTLENYYENPEQFTAPPNVAQAVYANPRVATLPNFPAVAKSMAAQGSVPPRITFHQDEKSGLRFAQFGNTVLPSGFDPSAIKNVTVTDPNTGEPIDLAVSPRSGMPILRPKAPDKAPRVSPEFTKALGELAVGLDDAKSGPKVRSGIKAMIDSAHTLRQLDSGQRDELYKQFKIGAGPAAEDSGDYSAELKLAQEALGKGRDRKTVEDLFRKRTGKSLPP